MHPHCHGANGAVERWWNDKMWLSVKYSRAPLKQKESSSTTEDGTFDDHYTLKLED